MRTNRFLFSVVIFLSVSLSGMMLPMVASGQQSPLTRIQVVELVNQHLPDQVVSGVIRKRGLDFSPDTAWVNKMEKAGAGEETLEVLRSSIPMGGVRIYAPEGAMISVDAKPMGVVDGSGLLVLEQIEAGNHLVSASKQGFHSASATVNVTVNQMQNVPLNLTWGGGYLSVRGLPPGAVANVTGLDSLDNNVEDLQVKAGHYELTASQSGMIPFHQSVDVAQGEHVIVNVKMQVDPAVAAAQRQAAQAEVTATLNSAQNSLESGNWTRARYEAQSVLATDPQNARAMSVTAEAYWVGGQVQLFVGQAIAAVRDGGSITVTLMHRHVFPEYTIHPATLTITPTGIRYDPLGYQCKYPAFDVPWSDIASAKVTHGRAGLLFGIQPQFSNEILLILKLKKDTLSKAKDMDFVSPGSRVIRYQSGYTIQSPPMSQQSLAAVAEVIRAARH